MSSITKAREIWCATVCQEHGATFRAASSLKEICKQVDGSYGTAKRVLKEFPRKPVMIKGKLDGFVVFWWVGLTELHRIKGRGGKINKS